MSDEIRYLGDLQLLHIKPGDKFVLTIPRHMTLETIERIQESWKVFAGEDVKVLILEEGMKLGAIRTQD